MKTIYWQLDSGAWMSRVAFGSSRHHTIGRLGPHVWCVRVMGQCVCMTCISWGPPPLCIFVACSMLDQGNKQRENG